MSYGKLYLIPNTLGDGDLQAIIPQSVVSVCNQTRYFLVENTKNARRFLKQTGVQDLNVPQLEELNEHTKPEEVAKKLQPLLEGHNMGIISDAGLPCIADPGAWVVEIAHQKGVQVVPLVGPSSIFMALMASGFNGQQFTFHGYLPREQKQRIQKIRQMEKEGRNGVTQIFMDTPYRNKHVFADLIKTCGAHTRLCIAVNITTNEENILTQTIGNWKSKFPDIHKKPCIFLLS